MNDIGVGLAGFGLAGRVFHAPVISAVPGLRLAAIVQRRGDTAALAYPGVNVVRTLDAMLAIDAIGLVVIATPTASHTELAERCLRAGRHVVIDKPFAPSSTEAASIIETARAAGRVLSVFHNRRYDGDFLTLRRLLGEGVFGRVVLFESHFDRYRRQLRPGSWRERPEPGSGVLFDLGSHLVDQALVLFGDPEAVTADVRAERDGAAADDAFEVMLRYRRMRALLRATMLAAEPGPRFVLRGTDATFVKHGVDPQEERLGHGDTPAAVNWGEEPRERWGMLTRATDHGPVSEPVRTEAGDYRRFYENVRDAIGDDAPLAVTPQQALKVIRILEMAQESSRTGRTIELHQA